ncbi:MAG: adenylate/guanylate cyclase domain-containing protein, partial [Actinomycetota bacterium]
MAMGRPDEGLALVDEATAAAVGGGLDPFTTGIIYCMTISACRDLTDYRRAGEWTDAAERWCQRQGVAGFPGLCRVHRAEIMHLRGDWVDAEREARRACVELRPYNLDFTARGFYEIGEIRLRVGDLSGAEEAFLQSHELNWNPEPGLSLLRLAQGDVGAAHASIKRALADAEAPALNRARRLPARVSIGLAAGDLEGAREAVTELGQIAETYATPALRAMAESAHGSLLLAERDPTGAAGRLRRAVEHWNDVGAPYEVARTRMALGEAYRADGDEKGAVLELQSARAAFERLGAAPDLRRVDELLGGEGITARAGERVSRTLMFTDIVGSTNLIETIGVEAWENVLDWHDRTLRSLFAAHDGEIADHTGDGFFVAFANPTVGVECAVAIQRALAEHRKTQGFAPQVRIGLHRTEASRKGRAFAGKGVHEAA